MKELKEKIDTLSSLVGSMSRHQRLLMEKIEGLEDHHGQLYRQQDRIYEQVDSLFSIFSLIKFRHPLPTMRGWPVSPDFIKLVISQILEKKPNCVVELGSGVSTIVSSYAMEKNGFGTLNSFDHDEAYAEETRMQLASHELSSRASVIHAPLKTLDLDGEKRIWYDDKCFDSLNLIDLLIVDGPPSSIGKLARFPAIPILLDRISPGGIVIVDDAGRTDEQQMLSLWQESYPFLSCKLYDTEKGTALLQAKVS